MFLSSTTSPKRHFSKNQDRINFILAIYLHRANKGGTTTNYIIFNDVCDRPTIVSGALYIVQKLVFQEKQEANEIQCRKKIFLFDTSENIYNFMYIVSNRISSKYVGKWFRLCIT